MWPRCKTCGQCHHPDDCWDVPLTMLSRLQQDSSKKIFKRGAPVLHSRITNHQPRRGNARAY